MRQFNTTVGNCLPLNRADIDTDQIIPAKYLKRIERTGFGEFLFDTWRKDADFILNDSRYASAPILLAGPNFGCGSSREHAPWALEDHGFRVLIAPSFADIFRNNCAKIGLLTVVLSQEDIDYLVARSEELPQSEIVVNLSEQTIVTVDGSFVRHFDVDPTLKTNFLGGLDPIDLTMELDDNITAFEEKRSELLPETLG
jgi:3-isopropylmalate/(R)-2-methylmalate dehydratase small subunit|tara:strand:+ start:1627 stop:2223 length:597 start_codon:yes stop_codon:yes gene_type:complete